MLTTIAIATALLALVPSTASRELPRASDNGIPAHLEIREERSVYSGPVARNTAKRDENSIGCKHGPTARSCWNDNYNIDTDMDLEWPTTGIVRKVGC